MEQMDHNLNSGFPSALLGAAAAALLVLGLLAPAPASAAYEQVGTFAGSATPVQEEKFSEEVQLGGVGGMAVNSTGAGGVPAGTVYAATQTGVSTRVAMFEPAPEGGLSFVEGWEVRVEGGEYERCGPTGELPDGEVVHPQCPTRVNAAPGYVDVEVDQTTGNVFLFHGESGPPPGTKEIVEYSADGGEEITRFGEIAAGQTVAESPGKLHNPSSSVSIGALAVNGEGEVYVFDAAGSYHRLMVFRPQSPGDYEHYVYAGEVAAGAKGHYPTKPVTDAVGNVYVAGEQGYIEEYAPETPSSYPAPPADPVCHFEFIKAGIESMTVNPTTGEPFFFSYKTEAGFKVKVIHRLGPCDEETGEFEETGKFEVRPERGDLSAMAFDPLRQIDPTRPPGVLYAGAQGGEPGSGVGKGEPGQSSLGYSFSRPAALPPGVKAESVSHVTATSAQLRAEIDPKGSQTRYAFQYLSEAEYQANEPTDRFAGAKEAPSGGAELGIGQGALAAAAAISGLSPDTAYRYRVIATSHCSSEEPEKVCEGQGADQSFRTFAPEAPGLPDQRAWELVSPAQKNGGQVFPAEPGRDTCPAAICKPGAGAQLFPMQSTLNGEAIAYQGQPFSHSEGAVGENEYVSRRDPKAGWQTTILSPALASRGSGQGYEAFATDLSRGLLLQINPTLSPEAPDKYANLYTQPTTNPLALGPLLVAEPLNRPASGSGHFELIYAGASADLSRIFFKANDALTEETPFVPEAEDGGPKKFNLYEWAEGRLSLVNVLPGNTETKAGASIGAPAANAISDDGSRAFFSDEAGQLYVREGAETTVAIPDSGEFLAASADGAEVLLTNGHIYDLEAETTTDLSEGEGGFRGLVGQSDDLSHLYFVDTAVLDEAPNEEGATAQAGKFNLYAWQKGTTRFVATLVVGDNGGGSFNLARDWVPSPSERTAEASPNGRWVTFLSQVPLSGYDNTGPCETDHAVGYVNAPCPEAFLYDSATDKLTCASCSPSGATPLGLTFLPRIAADLTLPQPHYLTDEGRLYFDSRDSLVPSDTNSGVEDVYQYEPSGVGSCKREAGCTQLISAGHEPIDSNFLAADESGRNVFFTTRDQLVLKDKDDAIDLYVAREGGGIPAETEVGRGECQGEACVPALSPPNDPTPGSSSFEGAGNVDEQKQSKKKHKKKKKHARKHAHKRAAKHNRGGAK
ncbi:MAG: hypothetical protein QOF85_1211 [Solirubrobacterales bacterium]|jgi:hypothetical protein|nr:hypothetical protein [Solirubrobacterales bacterium]